MHAKQIAKECMLLCAVELLCSKIIITFHRLIEDLNGYITQHKLHPIMGLREELEGFHITLDQAVAFWKYIVKAPGV